MRCSSCRTRCSCELRFRTFATINLIFFVLQNVLTVCFAAMNFGPYSFVWPMTISVTVTMLILWWWVRPPFAFRPQVRRWKYLLNDSTSLLVGEYGRLVVDQSDYVLLGLFTSVSLVGIYTVGFRVAIQALQLIMTNMASVLFPTFMRLADRPQKQLDAFLNVQRILAAVGISSCLLQAAMSEPFAKFAFPDGKWDASIIVMQVLSIGMATRMVGGAAAALMKSQGTISSDPHFLLAACRHSSCAPDDRALASAAKSWPFRWLLVRWQR